jgi:P-type conjugative transfer protein TrbJ
MAQEDPMTALTRRKILSGALACGVFAELLARTAPAEADLFGGDVAVLLAILTQSISTASSLISLVLQTTYQVRMMTTMLEQVSKGSFPALISFINTARFTYNSLTWGVRSMSYQLARIDSEYNSLFPAGPPPTNTAVAQHRAQYQAWNQEVVGASQVAARQQTSLSTLDAQATQTQAVLKQSQSASGEVEQLQLIAQMIGITNSELLVLNQTLATTGRVLTDMAAQSASEKNLSLGKSDDARSGYTDKGLPNAVPSTLP